MKKILTLLLMAFYANVHSASLHGDHTCHKWKNLDSAAKYTWLNAILAPLNMTYMSRVKPNEDKFGKLESMQPVAQWMDRYCEIKPNEQAIVGAMVFFEELTSK